MKYIIISTLLLLLLTVTVSALYVPSPGVELTVQAVSETAWELCIASVGSIPSGKEGVALLVTVGVPNGWQIEQIQPIDGWTVTVGYDDTYRTATVLLDSDNASFDGSSDSIRLAQVYVIATTDHTYPTAATVTVSPSLSAPYLYVRHAGGIMETYPLWSGTKSENKTKTETGNEACPETILLSTEPSLEGVVETAFWETVTEPDIVETASELKPLDTEAISTPSDTNGTSFPSEIPPTELPTHLYAVFLGYQESTVRDGRYAIRFLFYAPDERYLSPVTVFCRGGSPLSVTVNTVPSVTAYSESNMTYTALSPGFRVVTFYGLETGVEYRFLAAGVGVEVGGRFDSSNLYIFNP